MSASSSKEDKCERPVRKEDDAICCEECDEWFHIGCQKVSKQLYQALKNDTDELWYCKECKPKVKTYSRETKVLKKGLADLKKQLADFKTEFLRDVRFELKSVIKDEIKNDIMKEIQEHTKQIMEKTPTHDKVKEYIDEGIEEHFQEYEDRQRRKNNIVMYNIPESDKQNAEERQKEDEDFCKDLIESSLEVDNTAVKIQKVVRLGREPKQGRTRPTLLVLENESQKITLLKNSRKLRTETDPIKKAVGIAPDMTPKQREHDYYLRQEIRERKAQGETGLYIKNGRLCKVDGGGWRRN